MVASQSVPDMQQSLSARLAHARRRSDELFAIVKEEALYDRPIPERHRIVFYIGHLEAFDWNLLQPDKPFDSTLDRLFAFTVGVRLPGSLTTSNAPAPAGNGATWTPAMGEKVTLVAASRQYNRGTIALLVVAGAAALALVALLGVRLVRRRRAS